MKPSTSSGCALSTSRAIPCSTSSKPLGSRGALRGSENDMAATASGRRGTRTRGPNAGRSSCETARGRCTRPSAPTAPAQSRRGVGGGGRVRCEWEGGLGGAGEQQRPAPPSAPSRPHSVLRPPPRSYQTAPLRAVRRSGVAQQRRSGAPPACPRPPPAALTARSVPPSRSTKISGVRRSVTAPSCSCAPVPPPALLRPIFVFENFFSPFPFSPCCCCSSKGKPGLLPRFGPPLPTPAVTPGRTLRKGAQPSSTPTTAAQQRPHLFFLAGKEGKIQP